ncbi:peptidoglycan recognition protein [Streptomyces sp. Je 1-79]|uniref:peptidoglycan recognition protein family protein n=1 Tax=Streptomyces sp. Je 1-79 TaxID=2943847 RepID=UPI0021A2708B|nr:peptidoglycan recognition protein [Streptomyces sp. Je 1-79]MCT4356596.1 peptidoglycan recognition protein [Streptomyces sp. Je 1-79]
MRAYLATSIAVTCATALALPMTLATPAASLQPGAPTMPTAAPAALDPPAREAAPPAVGAESDVAGSTQSLPLAPLVDGRRAVGSAGAAGAQGLTRRDVRPFSLVGVVWDDVRAHLHGTVQVRTRASGSAAWSQWQDVEIHNDDHGADPGTAEASGAVRGATAPLWVGDSDGVEVRVEPDRYKDLPGTETGRLPAGLRIELVDPGPEPAVDPAPAPGARQGTLGAPQSRMPHGARLTHRAPTVEEAAAASVNAQLAPVDTAAIPAAVAAKPYIGPRPKIITRKGWGADERLREKGFVYTKAVKAAFVHHSATGNNYTCKQAPSVLRSIYRYHTQSSGWRDFGYNFAVDKCGNIYEGRAGGVAKPVHGAHTLGFNTNSMGIAVLGTFTSKTPPAAAVNAVARLTAWKLGLHGVNPKGRTTLVSAGGKYKKGKKVTFNAIAGHRDGFATSCPGARLYGKLGTTRTASAKLQGR